ncbi:MAG TPA: hypothetical protein VN408_15840 [Actinoplanes sp.]|nr:hypothetical protein [Actinoplanes sp.]
MQRAEPPAAKRAPETAGRQQPPANTTRPSSPGGTDGTAGRGVAPGRAVVDQLEDRHVVQLAERLVAKLTREQVDRLAHRLFDPMQRLLRADMRSSRERSARLRDGWR